MRNNKTLLIRSYSIKAAKKRLPNLHMPRWESEIQYGKRAYDSKITVICSIHESWSRPSLQSLKDGSRGCTKCINAALSQKAKDNHRKMARYEK